MKFRLWSVIALNECSTCVTQDTFLMFYGEYGGFVRCNMLQIVRYATHECELLFVNFQKILDFKFNNRRFKNDSLM